MFSVKEFKGNTDLEAFTALIQAFDLEGVFLC